MLLATAARRPRAWLSLTKRTTRRAVGLLFNLARTWSKSRGVADAGSFSDIAMQMFRALASSYQYSDIVSRDILN